VSPDSYQQQGHHAAGVQPGQILLGKYRVERVLGVGGMGVVVAATHVNLEERVAIKFLLPEALTSEDTVTRFLREARAAVRIKSEHVARVTDVGTLENGAPYMIMEYLDGSDLAVHTQRRGALPIEDAVEYVLQACEAIAEAHALGIVHRDLKPANLFVATRADGTPSVKVLDFGISKVSGVGGGAGRDLGMTKTSTIMGSPLYMSPEQMASTRDVDARTDIWALGTILYELLTGKVPFNADTITQLCTMILQQPPPPLRNLRPDAPAGLQEIIQRCLAKDRNHRYQNIAEFASALAPYAPRRARISIERVGRVIDSAGLGSSRPEFGGTLPLSQAYGPPSSAWGGSGSVPRRSRAPIIAIIIAVVLGVAGLAAAAVVLLRSPKPEAPPAPETAAPEAAPVPTTLATPAAPNPKIPPVVTPSPEPVPTPSAAAPTPAGTAKRPTGARATEATRPATPPKEPAASAKPPLPPPPPDPPEPPTPRKPADLLNDRK
jgi:eukaryotic-like serine/threonine-protein kinase